MHQTGDGQLPQHGTHFHLECADTRFRWIPIGVFRMGPRDSKETTDVPFFVTISHPFWMAECPVTQAQFERVTGQTPSAIKNPDLPVTEARIEDVVLFCHLLTEWERKAGRIPEHYVYRLPTEAEWEYACRAGRHGPITEELQEGAWSRENSQGVVQEVGKLKPNPWGLHDMLGNVSECCYSIGKYTRYEKQDPIPYAFSLGDPILRGQSARASGSSLDPGWRFRIVALWTLSKSLGRYGGFRAVLAFDWGSLRKEMTACYLAYHEGKYPPGDQSFPFLNECINLGLFRGCASGLKQKYAGQIKKLLEDKQREPWEGLAVAGWSPDRFWGQGCYANLIESFAEGSQDHFCPEDIEEKWTPGEDPGQQWVRLSLTLNGKQYCVTFDSAGDEAYRAVFRLMNDALLDTGRCCFISLPFGGEDAHCTVLEPEKYRHALKLGVIPGIDHILGQTEPDLNAFPLGLPYALAKVRDSR